MKSVAFQGLVILSGLLVASAATVEAEDISGTIAVTKTIFEDSQLVGDVTCAVVGAPCIEFGASHIKLRLNGFTITGPADPSSVSGCGGALGPPEDGISVENLSHVAILGPGLIERFRRHGIRLGGSTQVTVKNVISSHNCFSGIQLVAASDNDLEENVSVRNAIASGTFPCGGNCIASSHNNRIRRNEFSGNGSVGPPSNDFGVGLLGTSSGNVIEENNIGGNVNGILIQAAANSNLIRRNIIAGNPPVQVSATFGASVGVDIQNLSPPGANTFEENLCLTYSGAGPAPCPNVPKFAGHHNTSQASSQKP